MSLLTLPSNAGERELVRSIAQSVADLYQRRGSSIIEELLQNTIPDSKARFIHGFTAQNVRDELAASDNLQARFLQDEDFRQATLGTAWLVLPTGNVQSISGVADCTGFLNVAVDKIWERIKAKLQVLDRKALIVKCLRNLEALELDADQWKRTAQAVLAIYSDRADVFEAARRHQGERTRASLATRVLVEMGVCTCPLSGGKFVGYAEFDSLIADIVLLISIAYDSDAVHSGLAEPKIKIWPNGEFANPGFFMDDLIESYQAAFHSEHFQSHADEYGTLYEPKETGRRAEEVFDADFLSAFEKEYGITVQELVRANEVLEEYAVTQGRMVVVLRIKNFIQQITERGGLSRPSAEKLLHKFGLWPRERWDQAPVGFREKDLYPWRFRRPLSLIARPFVLLGTGQEDEVLYAAGFLHQALGYTVVSANVGSFEPEYFRTSAMRASIGSINNRRGHAFNDEVAEVFRRRGFQALTAVDMVKFKPPPELGDMGDVDVLAWTERGVVFVVECKSLRFAMTIGEIAEQLSRFRGDATDELGRHLARYNWLRKNPVNLGRVINIQDTALSLHTLLVTNTVVPMQFTQGLPLPSRNVVSFNMLDSVLSQHTDETSD